MTGVKSRSMGGPSGFVFRSSPRKRGPRAKRENWIPACAGMSGIAQRSLAGRLFHRFDDLLLGLGQLRMYRFFDRPRPFEELRLPLVDRDADRLRLFGAALAVVFL